MVGWFAVVPASCSCKCVKTWPCSNTWPRSIREVEETLAHLSTDDPWAKPMAWLLQLPGVGLVTALTTVAAIGDITRFPSAKKLVGYSGLGGSVSATGQTYRTGGITKQGRRDLRAVLVEAAWIAVEHHPLWKARFERLAARTGKKKAIIAIARKLLVVMWHVLTPPGSRSLRRGGGGRA